MRFSVRLSTGGGMKIRHWCSFMGVACSMLVFPVQAMPLLGGVHATVNSVQMSAWVERNGTRRPLAPGQFLQNRDKVLTGVEARVLIQLADGSTLKLGENAELHLNALDFRDDFVFTGAFELVRGAFRLSSGALAVQRALNVRVATIIGGMRNGDLWGSANESGDVLCVLDGQLMTVHAKDEERYLSDPPSCYLAPKGHVPKVAEDINLEQMRLRVLQTELQAGVDRTPDYTPRGEQGKVKIASLASEAEALEVYDQARQAGYAVSIKPRRVKGGTYIYRVTATP